MYETIEVHQIITIDNKKVAPMLCSGVSAQKILNPHKSEKSRESTGLDFFALHPFAPRSGPSGVLLPAHAAKTHQGVFSLILITCLILYLSTSSSLSASTVKNRWLLGNQSACCLYHPLMLS